MVSLALEKPRLRDTSASLSNQRKKDPVGKPQGLSLLGLFGFVLIYGHSFIISLCTTSNGQKKNIYPSKLKEINIFI